jgi:hypothetical protein
MFIPDPGSKNSNKRVGMKKISCHTFFWSHKFYKIDNSFIFEMLKKKILANELVTQKSVTKLSKKWIWDPGYGKNLFRVRIRNTDGR